MYERMSKDSDSVVSLIWYAMVGKRWLSVCVLSFNNEEERVGK
ncbi:hypothetical protein VCR17J2_340128 [Vibrio coralliirubri]|nr:hypothetical protein VCR17J2_340128 [Vibrio coralliirubri]